MNRTSPIGIFDSGLGGISVLKTIHDQLPDEDLIYLGDSLHNPYGTKTKQEITDRCIAICDEFMKRDVKAIVIACNTATSACFNLLREKYPVDIIGMEPALKVAAEQGDNQKIAVWATDLTLKEQKFANLMRQFEDAHTIYKIPCPQLVQLVEQGELSHLDLVNKTLKMYCSQSHLSDLNSIVLGCTHFVFYKKALSSLIGQDVELIDGNMGTSNHLKDVLETKDLLNSNGGHIIWLNTDEDKIELSKALFKELEVE